MGGLEGVLAGGGGVLLGAGVVGLPTPRKKKRKKKVRKITEI